MKRGFTLMELMVVVIVVGIIAAFAIPSYQKMIRKAHERDAIVQLVTLHGANEIYRAKSGGVYLPGGPLTLAAINAGLSINIIANDMTYSYAHDGGGECYLADAAWTGAEGGGAFTVSVTDDSLDLDGGSNPCCSAGTCPSLPACGGWGCP